MAKASSEAYDLSLFEVKSPDLHTVKSPEKEKKEAQRAQKAEKKAKRGARLRTGAILLVFVGLMVGMVISRIQLTELNDKITDAQEQLGILQSETSRLTNEIASNTSAESVDAYAQANGMSQAESYQIEYITVDGGDRIEVSESEPQNVFEQIGAAIFGWGAE